MTRKQKISRNRMSARIYHDTMQQHPELNLLPWNGISKIDRKYIASISREQLVAELTAERLTTDSHRFQWDGVPF